MRRLVMVVIAAFVLTSALAGDEKKLVGTYRLVERTSKDGTTVKHPPDVLGTMTFSKTQRSVIMKWAGDDGTPVSIAAIYRYTLSGGRYCETEDYGVQTNLGAPGTTYDTPGTAPTCTAFLSDASGISFDIPSEKLRLQVTRDGFRATTPRYTDRWEKVK